MRNLCLFICILLSGVFFAQSDSLFLQEFIVIGNPSKIDPITNSFVDMDSTKKIYQGSDPFFIINKYVPNVISQSDNGLPYGYSYMRMRGIDQTRINFTLNGIPLNEMEDQGIYFSNMPSFLDNISLIRISRGVGTSKCGISSIGGSVDLESEKSMEKNVSGEMGFGSFNSHKYSIGYSSGIKKNISFSSKMGYISTDGFRDHSGTEGYNYFGQLSHFGRRDNLKLWGFHGKSKNQLSWIPVSMDLLGQNYRTNLNTTEENDRFGQNLISLDWSSSRIKHTVLSSSVYYSSIDGIYTSYLGDNSLGRFGLKSNQMGLIVGSSYVKNRLIFNLGSNFNLYRRNHTLSFNDTPDSLFYNNMGKKRDIVLFSKINYKIGYFYAFGDIQYRHVKFDYTDDFGSIISYNWNFVNPKIGIKRIKNHHETWISFALIGREVTRSDIFNGNDNLFIQNGNLYTDIAYSDQVYIDITPESVFDLEIGHKITREHFNISTNYYLMSFRNERIMIKLDDITGLPIREIVDRSLRMGVEMEGLFFIRNWSIRLNGAYSYNKILSLDKISALSPNFIMNNSISYRINRIIHIGEYGNFVSGMYLDNTQQSATESYYMTGIFAEVKLNLVSINLMCNNIFNQKYYLPGGSYIGAGYYYPGSTSNYFISVKFNIYG